MTPKMGFTVRVGREVGKDERERADKAGTSAGCWGGGISNVPAWCGSKAGVGGGGAKARDDEATSLIRGG